MDRRAVQPLGELRLHLISLSTDNSSVSPSLPSISPPSNILFHFPFSDFCPSYSKSVSPQTILLFRRLYHPSNIRLNFYNSYSKSHHPYFTFHLIISSSSSISHSPLSVLHIPNLFLHIPSHIPYSITAVSIFDPFSAISSSPISISPALHTPLSIPPFSPSFFTQFSSGYDRV